VAGGRRPPAPAGPDKLVVPGAGARLERDGRLVGPRDRGVGPDRHAGIEQGVVDGPLERRREGGGDLGRLFEQTDLGVDTRLVGQRGQFAGDLHPRQARPADDDAVAVGQVEEVPAYLAGVGESLQRRRVFPNPLQTVVGRPRAQTHRAHVVGKRLLAAGRGFERRLARVGVDVGHGRLPDRTVQRVGEGDGDFVGQTRPADHPVELVLDEVVGRLVDDDQVDVAGEAPFERSSECQTGVPGTENGD